MASAWAVIEHEQKFLFIQRSAKTTRSLQWCFPGGGTHEGETLEGACAREVAEEVGLEVVVLKPLLILPNRSYFLCSIESGTIQLKTNECGAYAWVEPATLLGTGEIMDLRWVIQIFQLLGFTPEIPEDFNPQVKRFQNHQ